jgi:hypothetical protein
MAKAAGDLRFSIRDLLSVAGGSALIVLLLYAVFYPCFIRVSSVVGLHSLVRRHAAGSAAKRENEVGQNHPDLARRRSICPP